MKVAGQSNLNVTLTEDTQKLDEVVVIGYGTQKKMNLTGSVATISADNIATIPVSNISNAMAGRMPGIFSYNKFRYAGCIFPDHDPWRQYTQQYKSDLRHRRRCS
ncbi:MAG: hypothetical protein ACLR6J_15635 [Parabacteroides merdae]